MPTFEMSGPDGGTYHLEAPDEHAAIAAFGQHIETAPAFDRNDPRFSPQAETAKKTLEGIPLIGGLVPQASAAISALAHPLTGVGAEGETFGGRYTKNLEQERSASETANKEFPKLSMAAELIGGTVATLPIGMTVAGAKLLGLAGKTLPRMAAQGAVSQGAIGAADSAIRGSDPVTGAEIGGITGIAGPVLGRVVGNAVQGARNFVRGPAAAAPANVVPVAGVDVPLSGGQATGDVATQMMENTALRGGEGQAPQKVADQFFNQTQAPAVERARANIGQNLDRFGQNIAENPQAAAELASESVRDIERASKRNYQGLYDTATGLPGEFHADAFEGIGKKIKGSLTNSKDPVIIDDVTTPIASKAIQDIDSHISQLKVQNRADPNGPPSRDEIVGINLQGVDQARKRLVAMASAAERGSADRRAVGRVIGEFDNHVEGSISNGLFTGDDRALTALREARSAFSQHRQLFRSQGAGDDVGRAMERIVGRNGGDGATPTEVANYLFWEARVGGTGLSVRLAQRMQKVLGTDSPEWSGVRQGLWSRLSQATEGKTEFGPQKASERIYEFLNGSGRPLSHAMFSPQERQMMSQYAALLKQLVPKPGTVNYSNTAPVLRMLAGNTLKGISVLLGDMAGGPAGALAGLGVNHVGKALTERSAAGRVARSLYRSPAQNATDQNFAKQMSRYGALAARTLTPAEDQ